jgi:phage terminase large subunit-like protein
VTRRPPPTPAEPLPPWERWPGASLKIDDCGGKYYFDAAAADRICRFFPAFLCLRTGEFDGKRFEPFDWERELLLRPFFGWKRVSDRLRRFRKFFLFVPKKNGKSPLIGGVGLYLLTADGEAGAEIFSAAADKEQGRVVHDEAKWMVDSSFELKKRCLVFKDTIVYPRTGSKFRVVSSDAPTKHGPNVQGVLFDELHAQPNRDLYETLYRGTAARRQPVIGMATTAGDDTDSICYEEYKYAKKVLEGKSQDETYLPIIFEANAKDDWRSPATWAKANPSIGVTVKLDYLETECRAAIEEPRKQNSFKRLHLNIWTQTRDAWIPIEWWRACPGLPSAELLARAPATLGVDLSSTTDLTAAVVVVRLPETKPDGAKALEVEDVLADASKPSAPVKRRKLSINFDLAVIPYLWMPEDRVFERSKEDGIDYGVWISNGWIRTTPGPVVDYDFIFRAIVDEIAPRHQVKQVGYDKWQASMFAGQLEKAGLTVVEVRQGPQTLSTPCKVFHALTKARRVHHAPNEAMDWCVENVGVKEDENENIRPVKLHPKKRIDGVVAAVTALERLMRLPEPSGRGRITAID